MKKVIYFVWNSGEGDFVYTATLFIWLFYINFVIG